MAFVSTNARMVLAAAMSAVAVLVSPIATADGESPSYLLGKQAIDQQVNQFHIQLKDDGTLETYCRNLLQDSLRTGKIPRVDSPTDYVNGCQDQARAAIASH
ncbi:hypothetical protein MUNTM_01950 [Mycobacterium sp. MUNTM1]